jgi:hypothetical protein
MKTSLDTTLLIIYHQRHVSALNKQLWYELYITIPDLVLHHNGIL